MGYAGRWTMKGPWKHPNGVWYYRGEHPKDIWDAREALSTMGVRMAGGKEIRRSLGTPDRKAALTKFAEVTAELDSRWETLRAALRDGPTRLSERNIIAIAGERSRNFLAENDDNPTVGAAAPARAQPSPSPELRGRLDQLSITDEGKLRAELEAALRLGRSLEGDALAQKLDQWSKDPVLSIISNSLLQPVAETLVREHGADIQKTLDAYQVVPTSDSRAALLTTAARFQAQARSSLQQMAAGDYRTPDWVAGLPEYRATIPSRNFESIIDAEAKRRAQGKDAKPLPEKTVESFKKTCSSFARSRGKGGNNALTVTAVDLDRWKSALIERGELSNRTIANRVGTIKTVIRSGRALFRGEFSRIASELDEVRLPDFTPKPSQISAIYPDEAVRILRAARLETEARLHWLPWLCAYSGLRIAEACQLVTTDFFESEGHWFLELTTSGKRSLKTANSRRTLPLHRALIAEGFLAFVQSLPDGPLFPKGSADAITRWFHKLEGMHVGVSPNHGWRHLFKDLCRRYEVNDDARHYLTGHSTGGADQGYGRTRAMLPGLWRQMERIEAFEV